MPLEITRSFVENRDGTFDPYEPKVKQNSQYGNVKPIRPFELKTYLKVGKKLVNSLIFMLVLHRKEII